MNKAKILEQMVAYGKKVGYPDKIGPKEFLQRHLNDTFKVLLKNGLVKPEHYTKFRQAAILQYQLWFLNNR